MCYKKKVSCPVFLLDVELNSSSTNIVMIGCQLAGHADARDTVTRDIYTSCLVFHLFIAIQSAQ